MIGSQLILPAVFTTKFRLVFFALGVMVASLFLPTKTAQASFWCCTCCNCCEQPDTADIAEDAYEEYRDDFIADEFYNDVVRDDFRDWASQLSQTWVMQYRMIGGFYDAQAHLDAQRDLQKLTAEAVRDYMPSEAICRFGSLSTSLAATEQKAKSGQLLMSELNLARNLGTYLNIGSEGLGNDHYNRTAYFLTTFCNQVDENGAIGMANFCAATSTNTRRFNRDIDFARTLGVPETINATLTNNDTSPTESDLIMLGYNLYGNTQFSKRADRDMLTKASLQQIYQLTRSVSAKRSLAQNTFNAIVGLKSTGTPASFAHIDNMLRDLGMTTTDRDVYFAVTVMDGGMTAMSDASYYAQMELLTKRLYQNPAFYANLMDTQANVSRQNTAMESFELMQDRDIFQSMLRSEQLLALLVELQAVKSQSNIENRMTTK